MKAAVRRSEDIARIRGMHKNGMCDRMIAKRLSLSLRVVREVLKESR